MTSKEGDPHVALKAAVILPAYLQKEGSVWVLGGVDPVHYGYPAPGTASMRGAFTSKGARDTALVIGTSQRYLFKRKVVLPAGLKVSHLAPGGETNHPLVKASRKTRVNGSVLEDELSLEVTIGAVSQEGYVAFTGTARAVDNLFLAGIRLE